MFNSKKITLTATTCGLLEDLRLAIEVMTGCLVRLKDVKMNIQTKSGSSHVYIAGQEQEVLFWQPNDERLSFMPIVGGGQSFEARYERLTGICWVIGESEPYRRKSDGMPMWHIGRSAADRWEEPVYSPKT